jgi:biopolymer transport protein ExbD
MILRPPKPMSWELNLAPMVDVMMCLIIFFLLATELVDRAHRPVDLPFAVAAKTVDRSELRSRVVINIRESGDETVPAEYVVVGWDGRKITERVLLPEEIEPLLHTKADQAADREEDLRCVIRADKQVTYNDVEVVLRGCGLAQIGKIVFSANAGPDPEDRAEGQP